MSNPSPLNALSTMWSQGRFPHKDRDSMARFAETASQLGFPAVEINYVIPPEGVEELLASNHVAIASLHSPTPRVAVKSMLLVGAIFLVLGTALGFTSYLIDAQIPDRLFAWLHAYVPNKMLFLVLLNAFLLVINMIEIFSAIIIVVPIIVPVAAGYGLDPVHLGIIFLLHLEIGYMLPPLGLNLFLASSRFHRKLPELYRATGPFLLILLAMLALVTYLPSLSLPAAG